MVLFCGIIMAATLTGNWEPSVKAGLEELLPPTPYSLPPTPYSPYAVFDFDYTLALGDSSYTCHWRILETRDFRGDDMVKIMTEGVPEKYHADIKAFLEAADGVETCKRYWPIYRKIFNELGEAFGCEWRARLFSGYSNEELSKLALDAMREGMANGVYRRDKNVPSEKRGFVILPEVIELLRALREAGIKTYVVSGSYSAVLKVATGKELGLDVDPDCVFGCDTGVEAGRKTDFIRKYLAPKHGGKDPILVAGDSMGDYAMFTELKGVKKALVFARENKRDVDRPIRELIAAAPGPDGKYLVQGRDEPNGRLIPTHESRFE